MVAKGTMVATHMIRVCARVSSQPRRGFRHFSTLTPIKGRDLVSNNQSRFYAVMTTASKTLNGYKDFGSAEDRLALIGRGSCFVLIGRVDSTSLPANRYDDIMILFFLAYSLRGIYGTGQWRETEKWGAKREGRTCTLGQQVGIEPGSLRGAWTTRLAH